MSIQTQIKELRSHIISIAFTHGAKKISVFGSVARKEESNSSDIDFLVEFEDGRNLFDLIRLKQELESLLGRPVDVVSSNAIHSSIREQILHEAIQL